MCWHTSVCRENERKENYKAAIGKRKFLFSEEYLRMQ